MLSIRPFTIDQDNPPSGEKKGDIVEGLWSARYGASFECGADDPIFAGYLAICHGLEDLNEQPKEEAANLKGSKAQARKGPRTRRVVGDQPRGQVPDHPAGEPESEAEAASLIASLGRIT